MSTCKEPCDRPGHIDLRVHHGLPDVQPPLPGLPQKLPIPWPGIRRDGIVAVGFAHCVSCGAPVTVFAAEEAFCSEC
jgi:hypothetical protein